ncbi:hypothetical protein [Nocardioides perillae]|uniref:Uncharacterized protein n=1 Tax=Nocardioides perillae TaxID=1119534 RepID=A0A7Y9RTF0_9ACTN|nr:hypothetical protein [Nocardioides perillae]NYG54994.1 hypothetical protein [Nocardioides perillae]
MTLEMPVVRETRAAPRPTRTAPQTPSLRRLVGTRAARGPRGAAASQARLLATVDRVEARLEAASRSERLGPLDPAQRDALAGAVAADRVVLTALRAQVCAAATADELSAARRAVRTLRGDDHRTLLRTAVAARRLTAWAGEVAELHADDPQALALLAQALDEAADALAAASRLGVTSTRAEAAAVRRRLAAAVDQVWVLHEGQ